MGKHMNRLVETLERRDLEGLRNCYVAGLDLGGRYYVGATVVHMAVFYKFEAALPFFDQIHLDFSLVDANDRNPLHFAASQGHVPSVLYLLTHHPELNRPTATDCLLPVAIATIHNHVETVQALLSLTQVDPMGINGFGRNLYQTAASRGCLPVLSLLISHFHPPLQSTLCVSRSGLNLEKPPLALARDKNHIKVVHWIEEKVRLQKTVEVIMRFRAKERYTLGWA